MRPRSEERLGPEFSRQLSIETLGADPVIERIEATAAERDALARRLALLSMDRLTAVLHVSRPEDGKAISVAGHFEADVTQACVVSLAPLRRQVSEDFTSLFSLDPADSGEGGPVEVDVAGEDPPETLGPDGLDLGEAVVQQLAVALDPYPRDEAATLDALGWGGKDHEESAKVSPFKGLEILTRGR